MSAFGPSITKQPKGEHKGTVIFLHGVSESGIKASKLAATLDVPYLKFVFPTAPVRTVSAIKSNTTAWFDAYDIESFKLGKKDEAGISSAVEMVSKLVDGELTAGVPSERIVVGGYSNGGHVALQCLLSDSVQRLGGVFCLSSALSLVESLALPEEKKSIQVFLATGDQDIIVPTELVQATHKTLEGAGVKNVAFHLYEGMKHVISPQETEDLKQWLMKVVPAQ